MKISIITPVYNGEKYIGECIENILSQTFNDFELLIINDGSSDNTKGICEKIAKKDERVRVINLKNGGVSAARNKGIELAKGEYIAFVDADDKVQSKMYEKMVSEIECKNVDLVMCSYINEFDTYTEDVIFEWENKTFYNEEIKEFIMKNTVAPIKEDGSYSHVIMGSVWRCLYKKDLINKHNIQFRKDLRFSEDLIFVLEYLNICSSVYTSNECFYIYNKKTDYLSTTQKYIDRLEENIDIINKELIKILDIENFDEGKIWALRQVSNVYTLAVNIAIDKNIGFLTKASMIAKMAKRKDFSKYQKRLSREEFYGLNKLVVLSLKYKLYPLVVRYYSKKIR